ncbi:protein-tyrosine phosphatase family protein [Streptomyces sp. NPDC020379]|uniref:protein-tyrosine phosphatase family protein n=1 Tax=Streptomyces sp. NPDC020379 TaxID=3365071 RepID=UPI0037BADD14
MTTEPWSAGTPGVVRLPSGRLVRGRGLRYGLPEGQTPTLTVHMTGQRPPEPIWESMWVPWRDFWLPADPGDAIRALRLAHDRAATERVEVCCGGGVGRTGTALSVMCVFEGMGPEEAVTWVRRNYHSRAVEVPWQRRFIRRAFTSGTTPGSARGA